MGLTVPEPPPQMWQTTTTRVEIRTDYAPEAWRCAYCGTIHVFSALACGNCGAQRQERGRVGRILGQGRA